MRAYVPGVTSQCSFHQAKAPRSRVKVTRVRLAGPQRHPLEALELLGGLAGRRRIADVELGHLGAGAGAGVGDVGADLVPAAAMPAPSGARTRTWCTTARTRTGTAA